MEAGFVAREAWAFEAAYVAHRRLLYGAAYDVLHDAPAAEDCVHDVLVRLWQRGHAYATARGSLRAFLAVCVRNEALSRRRRDVNRSRIEREQLRIVVSEPSHDTPVADRLDVEQAMGSLSELHQRTIRLAYTEGLTLKEIAQQLDEPLGTIKSRLSNALSALRRALPTGGER